jgi:hypothetical protein
MRCSLLAPPARRNDNLIVIRLVGESWEDVDQGSFEDAVTKMFWVSQLAIFSNFSYFLVRCAILFLSCTQEHFRSTEGVSK